MGTAQRLILSVKGLLQGLICRGIDLCQWFGDRLGTPQQAYLVAEQIAPTDLETLRHRLEFFIPNWRLVAVARLPLRAALGSNPILVWQDSKAWQRLNFYRGGVFDVNPRTNPHAPSAYCFLAEYCDPDQTSQPEARERFNRRVAALQAEGHQRVYVFGTGPSLAGALERDWSDGYRLVCNTIVRDPETWRHLAPHFIVAGDALYHFGDTAFARTFRRDLAQRLAETETFFVYPAHFHPIARRELAAFADRLLPIPTGKHAHIHLDLTQEFSLPQLGNVLPWLLLPLACTLGRDVRLWGFDGRAPQDQLFWANSSRHSYPELLPELTQAFPAFFNHYLPTDNPQQYVNTVHGDVLEQCMAEAEQAGWHFSMLHKSWTPTLQKRYVDD